MFCLKCGKQIPPQSVFCLYCGIKLPTLDATPENSTWDIRPRVPPAAPFHSPLPTALETPYGDILPSASHKDVEEIASMCSATDATIELSEIEPRQCSACGRALPETSISTLCVTCLNNRSFVATDLPDTLFDSMFAEDQSQGAPDHSLPIPAPATNTDSAATACTATLPASKNDFQLDIDLDSEYPAAYVESPLQQARSIKNPKKLAIWIFLLSAILLAVGVTLALPHLLPTTFGDGSTTSTSLGNAERKVVSFAHEMLKDACANPESVSFHKDISVEETDGVWSITETFDRTSKQGDFTTTTYTVLLRLDSEKSAGYLPLMLRIDDTTIYDHTTS